MSQIILEKTMNQSKRNFFKVFGAGAVGVTLTSIITKPTELVANVIAPKAINDNSKLEVKIHPQSVKRIKKG